MAKKLKTGSKGKKVGGVQESLALLGFKVADKREYFGKSTTAAIKKFQENRGLKEDGIVGPITFKALEAALAEEKGSSGSLIRGQILINEVHPLANIPVRAFFKTLKGVGRALGTKGKSGEDGSFEIRLNSREITQVNRKCAGIVVRAEYKVGDQAAFDSLTLFQLRSEEYVTIYIEDEKYKPLTEIEQYKKLIAACIKSAGINEGELVDFKVEQISHLSISTGIDFLNLNSFFKALTLGRDNRVDALALYGLFRQNLPTELKSLVSREPRELRAALLSAVENRIIPPNKDKDPIASYWASLKTLIGRLAFQETKDKRPTFWSVLSNTGIDKKDTEKLVGYLMENEKPYEDFWKELKEKPEFDEKKINKIQLVFQLWAQTGNHAPLVQHLYLRGQKYKVGNIRELAIKELVQWDEKEWIKVFKEKVGDKPIGVPPDVPGDNDQEKYANFAGYMVATVEAIAPTAMFGARLFKDETIPDNKGEKKDLATFFKNNPTFEFYNTQIDKFFANGYKDSGITDKDRLIVNLKTWQRISQFVPFSINFGKSNYDLVSTLKKEGLESAHAIKQLGQVAFVKKYRSALGDSTQAKTIFNLASSISTKTQLLLASQPSRYRGDYLPSVLKGLEAGYGKEKTTIQTTTTDISTGIGVEIAPGGESAVTDIDASGAESATVDSGSPSAAEEDSGATWATLFGTPAWCECKHCRSVFSPAAYLVYLLDFLDARAKEEKKGGRKSALDILLERRRDLAQIQLNCKNTNTVMPYVDLVNEIMECAVESILKGNPGVLTATCKNRQTRGTQAELGLQPEYFNENAYKGLNQAVFPWTLPFDFWEEGIRIYLERLGIKRFQLMEAFQKKVNSATQEPDSLEIAGEYLGLTILEQRIIGTSVMEKDGPISNENIKLLNAYWGLKEGEKLSILFKLKFFLQKSELKYTELLELLDVSFINLKDVTETLKIEISPTCDLDTAKLINFSWNHNDKIHRFLRLQRKLGWSIRDLGKAFVILEVWLDRKLNIFWPLSRIQRLHEELGTPLLEIFSWYGKIDTAEDKTGQDPVVPSLYDTLFLNKTVLNPEDQAFVLNDDRDELKNPNDLIKDHIPVILGAYQVKEKDFLLLLEYLSKKLKIQDPKLNLANLSFLYRNISLAKALKLTIQEFLALNELNGANIFNLERNFSILNFIPQIENIRKSGFSIAELDYLLRNKHKASEDIRPGDDQLDLYFHELRRGLFQIHDENQPAPEPTEEWIRQKLSLFLGEDAVDQAVSLLDGTWAPAVEEGEENEEDEEDEEIKNFIKAYFSEFIFDAEDFKNQLKAIQVPKGTVENEKRYHLQKAIELLAGPLLAYLRMTLSDQLILQKLSNWLELETATVRVLVEQVIKAPSDFEMALADRKYVLNDLRGVVTGGLRAIYTDDSGKKAPRLDPIIQFDWNAKAPPQVNPNQFIATWTGKIEIPYSETFSLELDSERNATTEGTLNGKPFQEWQNEVLEAGHFYDVQVIYDTSNAGGHITFNWSGPSTSKQVVPARNLFPDDVLKHFKDAYLKLQKSSLLIKNFNISKSELLYISRNSGKFGGFDFNHLPLDNPEVDVRALYGNWTNLMNIFKFRDRFRNNEMELFDIFEGADSSVNDAKTQLANYTEWDVIDVNQLVGKDGFNFEKEDFLKGENLDQLFECFKIKNHLGVSVKKCFEWSRAYSEADDPSGKAIGPKTKIKIFPEIKQTLKARYDEETWSEEMRPTQDALREKQRAALVAYLLHNTPNQNFEDSNDLYAYYLIDVEMSPCMKSSRIKQAILSVQLFFQRCFLNLEEQVTLTSDDARVWKWSRYYRFWEANRKVFLYPENWIYPELRDDKSSFFKDLENDLLQNEVTDETAEQAYINYLEKLDSVAHLEIMGMYIDPETEFTHVVGRTRGVPHIYYYRKREIGNRWSAWEKIDLDIEADHLIPVIYNRRLYLFWPVIREKTIEEAPVDRAEERQKRIDAKYELVKRTFIWPFYITQPFSSSTLDQLEYFLDQFDKSSFPTPAELPDVIKKVKTKTITHATNLVDGEIAKENAVGANAKKIPGEYWEIKMAWSEYKSQAWTPKKVSNEALEASSYSPQKSDFAFWAEISEDQELIIGCGLRIKSDRVIIGSFKFIGCNGRTTIGMPSSWDFTGTYLKFNKNQKLYSPATTGVKTSLGTRMVVKVETDTGEISHLPIPFFSEYGILYPHQYRPFSYTNPFFYEDDRRNFYVSYVLDLEAWLDAIVYKVNWEEAWKGWGENILAMNSENS